MVETMIMVNERYHQLAGDKNEEKQEKRKTFPFPSFLIPPSHCVIEIHNKSASLQFIHTK